MKLLIVISKIKYDNNTDVYLSRLLRELSLSSSFKKIRLLDFTGRLKKQKSVYSYGIFNKAIVLGKIQNEFSYDCIIDIGGLYKRYYSKNHNSTPVITILSDMPGKTFYKSFYILRDKTIREFYDSFKEKSPFTEREKSFHNTGLNNNYFHQIDIPLKDKKFRRLYKMQACAFVKISNIEDRFERYCSGINKLSSKGICCFVSIKRDASSLKFSKLFYKNKNVIFLYNFNESKILPLINKVNYVVLNEYEDCIDAVLMEKKIVLIDYLANSKNWKTKIPDPKKLRGICLYYFMIPFYSIFDSAQLEYLTKINNYETIINRKITNINMLVNSEKVTTKKNWISEWFRLQKKFRKLKRDPKRFLLDAKNPFVRKLNILF
ncbi:MAG: hypothetical protein GY714_04350 [Desulfobacterales bacterium]|nr:hypothetical protein [Desulfobacterales bacterium]